MFVNPRNEAHGVRELAGALRSYRAASQLRTMDAIEHGGREAGEWICVVCFVYSGCVDDTVRD